MILFQWRPLCDPSTFLFDWSRDSTPADRNWLVQGFLRANGDQSIHSNSPFPLFRLFLLFQGKRGRETNFAEWNREVKPVHYVRPLKVPSNIAKVLSKRKKRGRQFTTADIVVFVSAVQLLVYESFLFVFFFSYRSFVNDIWLPTECKLFLKFPIFIFQIPSESVSKFQATADLLGLLSILVLSLC